MLRWWIVLSAASVVSACSDGAGDPGGADGSTSAAGCGDAALQPLPVDTAEAGPWPVGARTVTIGRLTVEVWYPAAGGSEIDSAPATYDIRDQLPESQRDKITDADNPIQRCNCARDLPVDDAHGPYPVVVFVHGTAAFRTQSLDTMTHWASRGFVVLAADHPGLKLADSLAMFCPDEPSGEQDLTGDVDAVLAELRAGQGALAFLRDIADTSRIAVAGHSAGGNAAARLADREGVRVSIPMASNSAPVASTTLESSLLMGATADKVVDYSATQSAYDAAAAPKRLVGIANSGHLAFSDLCELRNGHGKNIVEVAQENDVCGVFLASFLFDCEATHLDPGPRNEIVRFASSAVLEDVLMCTGAARNFSVLEAMHPDVEELREQL